MGITSEKPLISWGRLRAIVDATYIKGTRCNLRWGQSVLRLASYQFSSLKSLPDWARWVEEKELKYYWPMKPKNIIFSFVDVTHSKPRMWVARWFKSFWKKDLNYCWLTVLENIKTQLVINWLLRCRYDFERIRLSVFLAPDDFMFLS